MREEKFKELMDKFEEELLKEETEESLSMTRELKFKDLQEHIDSEVEVESDTAEIDLSMTREMKFGDKLLKELNGESFQGKDLDELSEEEIAKEKLRENLEEDSDDAKVEISIQDEEETTAEVDIEDILDEASKKEEISAKELKIKEINKEDEKKKKDDDIYLTTSFKPFRKRFRIGHFLKVLFILLIIFGAIGSFIYYVGIPLYKKYIDSKPKIIFDHAVDYVALKANSIIDFAFASDEIIYNDINFELDTNVEDYRFLNGTSYGLSSYLNIEKKLYDFSLYIKNNNNKYGVNIIKEDTDDYIKYSTSDKYILVPKNNDEGQEKENQNLFAKLKKDLNSINIAKDDTKYVINKMADIIKEMLSSDYITSSKDEIEVAKEKVKVTRNSYEIGKKEAEALDKRYYELVTEDEKLVELLANLEELNKEEYLKKLESDVIEEYDNEYKLIFNIYTIEGTKFVGFDIEENGFRTVYYYKNQAGDFEFYINMTEDEDCLAGNDCVANEREVLELTGEAKDNRQEVKVKYNDILYASLDVWDFNKEKINTDYEIYNKEETIKGNLTIGLDNNKKEYNITLGFKKDDEYMNFKAFLGFKANHELHLINKDNIISIDSEASEMTGNNFEENLRNAGIYENYLIWYTIIFNTGSLKGEGTETPGEIQVA